jgi:hypothetical protein
MNWKHWLHGLIAAFIGGGAAAVAATVGANLIAPQEFNLGAQIGNFIKLAGTSFLVNGILNAVFYLKQSPLPPDDPEPPTKPTP